MLYKFKDRGELVKRVGNEPRFRIRRNDQEWHARTEADKFFLLPCFQEVAHHWVAKEPLNKLRLSAAGAGTNLYPPRAAAANVATRKLKIPPAGVNQNSHFSTDSRLFTCASVNFASPQRAIEK